MGNKDTDTDTDTLPYSTLNVITHSGVGWGGVMWGDYNTTLVNSRLG